MSETVTVFHGTPFDFDTLHAGSWVTDSLPEAVIHLVRKNIEVGNTDLSTGWIIWFEDFKDQDENIIDLFDTKNMVTKSDLPVSSKNRRAMKDVLKILPKEIRDILKCEPEDIVDLTDMLKDR